MGSLCFLSRNVGSTHFLPGSGLLSEGQLPGGDGQRSVVVRINPHQGITVIIFGYVAKGIKVAEGIKIANQQALK